MTKITFACMSIAAIFLLSTTGLGKENRGDVRIPSCGFCAAFSFLECSQSEVDLDSLTAAFDHVDISGPMTVFELRKGLSNVGFETNAVRFNPDRIQRVPTPSVLFISPGKWPRRSDDRVGHYVTLVKFVDDRAVLLDWAGTSVEPAIHMAAKDLPKYWDGVAIVPAQKSWLLTVSCTLALLFGFAYLAKRFRMMKLSASAVVIVFVSMGCSGSGSSVDPKDRLPTLVFDQPLGDLGRVTRKSISSHEFKFRVWDENPVTIKEVQVSCGCTVPDDSLIGVELKPGSEHTLRITVRPDGGPTIQTKSLRVITTPSSDVPVVLAVSYTPKRVPQISVNKLVVDGEIDFATSAKLTVSFQRNPSDAKLELIRTECEFGDFLLAEQKPSEVTSLFNVSTGETITKDTLELSFRGKAYSDFGTHKGNMTLAFSDGTEISVPAEIKISHPIKTSLEKVFVGVVNSGESNEDFLRITRASDDHLTVSHEGELISSVSLSENMLTIRTTAPGSKGRHEANVLISSKSFPTLTIPVVCIVK